jgi:alginate O-acetyltransferase complex protein AlgI
MPFYSTVYFVFLPTVYLLFRLCPDPYRWSILLLCSFIFYGFLLKPALLMVLVIVIFTTYFTGRFIEESTNPDTRRKILWIGIFTIIVPLIYFKYYPFILINANLLLKLAYSELVIEVPSPLPTIALSFFIFQAISYLIDIYYRMLKPEYHLGYFALYVSFFPKLLQGPIERGGTLLQQLRAPYEFNYDHMRSGLLLFAVGLFKKIVIADRLALYVNPIYGDVHAYTGISLIIATYAFALQLYFDSSAYADMARGTARIFGIKLTDNFNAPYFATSCADFWRRWHISFSTWLQDYIFVPLQMKFRNFGNVGTALAMFITFVLAGIWHGASWNFVIFGALHGIYLVSSIYYRPYQKQLYQWLGIRKNKYLNSFKIFCTFNLISFSFIFFRSENLEDAWYIVTNIGNISTNYLLLQEIGLQNFINDYIAIGNGRSNFTILLMMLLVIGLIYRYRQIDIFKKPVWFRWSAYNMLITLILLFQVGKSEFIYFRF